MTPLVVSGYMRASSLAARLTVPAAAEAGRQGGGEGE
jgi:hypothetical protein